MADSGPKGSNESTDALTQAVSGLTIDILNDKNDCTESSSESTPSSSSSNDVTTTITVYDNGDGSISRTATSTAAVTTQQQVHATQHHKQGGIVKLIQDVTNQFEWKHKPKTEKKPIGESGDLYRDLNAIIDMILHNVRVCSLYLPGQHVRTLLLLLVRLGKRDGFDYDFSRFGGEGYVRDFESFKSLLFRIRADCSSDSENGNENGADGSEKGETNKEIFEKLFKSMPNGNTDLVDRLDVYLQRYYDLEHIDKDLLRASGDFFHAAHSSRGANAFIRSPQDAIDLALQLESITKVLKEYFGTDLDRNLADRTGSFVGDDISGSDDHETGGASALPRFTAAQCYVQQVFSRKMRDCARLLFRFCNYLEVESGGSDPTQMAGGRRAHAMKSLRRLRQSPALRSSVTKAMKAILGLLDIVSHFVRAGNSDGVVDAYGLSSFQKRYAANLERHNEEGRSSHASDVLGSVLDRSVKELQDEVDTRNTKESDGTDLTERRARSSVLKYLLKQKFKYTQRLNTYLVYDGEDALDGTPASLLAVRSASSARKCQVNTNAGAGSTTGNALAVASDSTPHDRVSPGGVSQETGAEAKTATDDVDDNDHAGVSADQAYAYVFKTLTSQLHPEEGVEKKKRRVVVKRKDLPNKNNNGTSNDSHDDEVNDDENVHHRGSGGDEVEFQDSESDNNNHTPGLRFNVQLSTNFVKATRSIHEFMNTLDKEWAKYDRNSNTSDAEHSPSPLEIKAQAHRAHALDDAVERFFEDKAATQGQIEGRRFVMNLLQRVIRRVDPGLRLELFGSSAMGLATKTSDLDIGMVRPGDDTVDIFKQPDAKKSKRPRRGKRGELSEDAKFLKIICKSLRRNPRDISNIEPIYFARVPLIKFVDQNYRFQCDLSLVQRRNVLKSDLFCAYVDFDERVAPLITFIKAWSKARGIGDASKGFLNSFALSQLVICFLQIQSPPILPCLQHLDGDVLDRFHTNTNQPIRCKGTDVNQEHTGRIDPARIVIGDSDVKEWNTWTSDDRAFILSKGDRAEYQRLYRQKTAAKRRWSNSRDGNDGNNNNNDTSSSSSSSSSSWQYNNASLSQLLYGFYEFYGRVFRPDVMCVSIRRGMLVDANAYRKNAGVTGFKEGFKTALCVEDPFDPCDNVARVVQLKMLGVILEEFERAHKILKGYMYLDDGINPLTAAPGPRQQKDEYRFGSRQLLSELVKPHLQTGKKVGRRGKMTAEEQEQRAAKNKKKRQKRRQRKTLLKKRAEAKRM